ncbi:MAG: alpha/beta hydrolase [Gammaproteobacteria bacterium]|nr:alpha/beta hydrolase [Gammaproteobacteria bacterium]
MRSSLRIAARMLGVAVAVVTVTLAAALWAYRDVPAARLEEKYASPAMRFLHIDGVRIHYRDEGSGPVVLLLHANFSSLLAWDPWVEALADRYRVVRFDFPAFGLTGPDPSGDYSNRRTVALTEKFVDALGLRRFTIAGTSLGGSIALRFAADHPERIERLILLNPGILEGRAMAQSGTRLPETADILRYITPRALVAYLLRSRAGNPALITEEHIDRWYDLWMREGNRAAILARLRAYDGGNVAGVVGRVRAPVLILWGDANPQTPPEQASELAAMLTAAASVRLLTYPGVGHPALEEAGERIGRDVRAWLDGTLPPLAIDSGPAGGKPL